MDEKLMKQIVEAAVECFGMHGRAGQASGDW